MDDQTKVSKEDIAKFENALNKQALKIENVKSKLLKKASVLDRCYENASLNWDKITKVKQAQNLLRIQLEYNNELCDVISSKMDEIETVLRKFELTHPMPPKKNNGGQKLDIYPGYMEAKFAQLSEQISQILKDIPDFK